MQLLRLTLTDFRSYAALTWRPRGAHRRAVRPERQRQDQPAGGGLPAGARPRPARRAQRRPEAPRRARGWAVAGRFATAQGETDIGTGTPPAGSRCQRAKPRSRRRPAARPRPGDRRVFRLDGAAPRSQAEIAARVAAVWLTPQMDRLFLEGLSGRRRFLDRLVWALEPGHAREIAAHDAAMGSRNRLLQDGRPGGGWDPSWLAGLEDEMARHAVAATAARMALVGRLNAALAGGAVGAFPAARIGLVCPIAERLASQPALAVEDWLRAGLAANRARDAAAGTAALGAHRTDMALADAATGTPAALASTGEQKALLIGVDPGPRRRDRRGARFRPAAAARRTGGASRPGTPRRAVRGARDAAGADADHRHRRARPSCRWPDVAEGLQTGGGDIASGRAIFAAEIARVPPVPPAV